MELEKFFDTVEQHSRLAGYSIDLQSKEGRIAVEDRLTGLVTVLPAEAVEKAEWSLLEDILLGKREPEVLYHMTRVVGYYSRVENWNKSKVGELKDRHRGNYVLAEA